MIFPCPADSEPALSVKPPLVGKRLAVIRLGIFLAVLAAAAVMVALYGADAMGDWLDSAADSAWGPVAFVALYVVLVVLMMPGSLGTVAAGAIFGAWLGFATALTGASIGACLAFVIARRIGREGALALTANRAPAVDRLLEERGLLAVIVLRLLPIVPFNALNYAAGLTGLRFGSYAIGTVIGMIPGTFIVAVLADRADNPMSPAFAAALGTAVVAFLASAVVANRLRARVDLT